MRFFTIFYAFFNNFFNFFIFHIFFHHRKSDGKIVSKCSPFWQFFKSLVVQTFQLNPIKFQPIAAQFLMILSKFFVVAVLAIFAITHNWKAQKCKMRPDLMRSAGQQFHLKHTCLVARFERFDFC